MTAVERPLVLAVAPFAGAGVVLVVTATIAFVLSLDPTMVTVANPTIADSLGATLEGTQWITSGFFLALAVLLIPSGALADRVGHARMLTGGLTLFSIGALLASIAGDVAPLVVSRLLMGIGAAAMQPASVAAFRASVAPEQRSRAMGIWAAIAVSGSAAAPVLAGAVLGFASWRALFLGVAVIGCGLLIAVIARVRGMPHDGEDLPLHVLRNLALAAGLGLLTWGLIRAGAKGWGDVQVLVPSLVGLVVLTGVAARLLRAGSGEFDVPPIAGCIAIMGLASVGYVGVIFLLGILLQRLGGSPLEVGLQLLPYLALAGAVSPLAGRIEARFGAWRPLVAAVILELVALSGLSRVDADSSFGSLWPWLVVLGVSFGLVVPSILDLLMRSAPSRRSAVMGASQMAATQVGGLLAIAVLGSVVASTVTNRYGADIAAAGLDVPVTPEMTAALGQGVVTVPAGLDAAQTALLERAGLEAFAGGMGTAIAVAMVPALIALMLTLGLRRTLSNPRPH